MTSNKENEKLACSYSSWNTMFADSTVQSITIPLPDDVVEYLKEGSSLVLPLEASKNSSSVNTEYEGECSDWTDSDGEALLQPTFPNFSNSLEKAIKDLGGEVFVKLNWSAPLDAAWITSSKTLKCAEIQDIYLLLKSSELLSEDLSFSTESSDFTHKNFCIVLKQWQDIYPGNEFHCFVINHNLVAISQRYFKEYYPYIAQSKFSIIQDIMDFFNETIKGNFPLSHYTFDIIRRQNGSITLLDFGTLHSKEKTSLFSLEDINELAKTLEEFKLHNNIVPAPELRFLGEDPGIQPSPFQYYGVSPDVSNLVNGSYSYMDALIEEVKQQTSLGSNKTK